MPAVEYTVKRPRNHPGPPILRLLLKGTERRMKKGGETIAKLDPEKDAKVVRDLEAAGYKVAPAVIEEPVVEEAPPEEGGAVLERSVVENVVADALAAEGARRERKSKLTKGEGS